MSASQYHGFGPENLELHWLKTLHITTRQQCFCLSSQLNTFLVVIKGTKNRTTAFEKSPYYLIW